MGRLKPDKLYVTYLAGATPDNLHLPRRYTLTHSDVTGELFLSIGSQYDTRKTTKFYTRLMRDEVLAELTDEESGLIFKVFCHVSGGIVFGRAKWRYDIFQSQLPLALEAIRYGDGILFEQNPELEQTPVIVHFKSTNSRFNKIEDWGVMADYKTPIDESHT